MAVPTKNMFIVIGPAGCGKSTVASYLAEHLNAPCLEGDEYHSSANKTKMACGTPLVDEDRWDWLANLFDAAMEQLRRCSNLVVSCSALKRAYRDVFRTGVRECDPVRVHFLYLKVDERALQTRVRERVNHFMKDVMVRSQLDALEEPTQSEVDLVELDAQRSKQVVCQEALRIVRKMLRNAPISSLHDA